MAKKGEVVQIGFRDGTKSEGEIKEEDGESL